MTKRDDLLAKLNGGWVLLPDLMAATGWQTHTVRGALSTLAKGGTIKIDRKREGGVTFYRASPVNAESEVAA